MMQHPEKKKPENITLFQNTVFSSPTCSHNKWVHKRVTRLEVKKWQQDNYCKHTGRFA